MNSRDSVVNALQSGTVPARGAASPSYGYQDIPLSADADIDVLQNRVAVVIRGWRVTFDHVQIDETAAREWLRENAGTAESQSKPGPKSKLGSDTSAMTDKQRATEHGVSERTIRRWRKAGKI